MVLALAMACAKKRQPVEIPLVDELPRARIKAPGEQYVKEQWLGIKDDARRCIFMHPESSAEFDLLVPLKAKFSFAVGMPHDAWDKGGDGVEFTVAIAQGSGEPTVLFRRYVNPKANEEDRRWFEETIDLSLYEGQRVRLILSTSVGPAGNPGWDFAGWADPVIRGLWW